MCFFADHNISSSVRVPFGQQWFFMVTYWLRMGSNIVTIKRAETRTSRRSDVVCRHCGGTERHERRRASTTPVTEFARFYGVSFGICAIFIDQRSTQTNYHRLLTLNFNDDVKKQSTAKTFNVYRFPSVKTVFQLFNLYF